MREALTAKQWASALGEWADPEADTTLTDLVERATNFHAKAALCLHGQEFGFMSEDVELVRAMAEDLKESARVNDRPNGASAKYAVQMSNLADRISALLPPEKT